GDGGPGEKRQGGIVVDHATPHGTAVAVAGVFAQAHVRPPHQLRGGVCHGGDRPGHRTGGVPCRRAGLVLVGGDTEKQHPADTDGLGFFGEQGHLVHRQLEVPGHRPDRVANPLSIHDEHRKHELGGVQAGLGDGAAQGVAHAQAAGTDGGKRHVFTSRERASSSARARWDGRSGTTAGRWPVSAAAVVCPIAPTTSPSRARDRNQPSTAEGDAKATASTGSGPGAVGTVRYTSKATISVPSESTNARGAGSALAARGKTTRPSGNCRLRSAASWARPADPMCLTEPPACSTAAAVASPTAATGTGGMRRPCHSSRTVRGEVMRSRSADSAASRAERRASSGAFTTRMQGRATGSRPRTAYQGAASSKRSVVIATFLTAPAPFGLLRRPPPGTPPRRLHGGFPSRRRRRR